MLSPLRRLWRWWSSAGVWGTPSRSVPPEVAFLRLIGLAYFALIIVGTITTKPYPALHGRGLAVLIGLVALVGSIVVGNPRSSASAQLRIATLLVLTGAAALLAAVQSNGLWEATPYYVAIVAAMRLERRLALIMLGFNLVVLGSVAAASNQWGQITGTLIGAVPWFLVMRQMRHMREQNLALEASQAAEARAAAAAERGRIAREMHDVLAHTLSALALQLESTRLLAHDRGVAPDVSRALDQAHGLAASGLDEARRAISAARGDALPGPERVQSLAETLAEQSGLAVSVDVRGEPRELGAEARLAVYRTAQEALTNVRRHATPERVEVRLDYAPDSVALEVCDHGAVAVAASRLSTHPGSGYGLTGMRERAELLGGTLVAEPTEDGFRVKLVLPA